MLVAQTQGSATRSLRAFSLFMNLMRYSATPSSPTLTVWECHRANATERM